MIQLKCNETGNKAVELFGGNQKLVNAITVLNSRYSINSKQLRNRMPKEVYIPGKQRNKVFCFEVAVA